MVEKLTLGESGDLCVLKDAKLTRWLGVQWGVRDVMMSPLCKELKVGMVEYKGP